METFITTIEDTTKVIKRGDPNFLISNKLSYSPRASINVSQKCPQRIVDIIVDAYTRGWIEPVATVTEEEYTWMTLRRK
jgi:hypothetical protein